LISLLEQLKKLQLFSSNPTPLNEIVKYKRTSIISLKGVEPYVTETFVAQLLRDLFDARKKEEIPPFLLVLEEAHNFCPERSFGKLKSSDIIRIIAGEGRKFGIGLCVISQRPAKVDKNVVSQCSTQILLKMSNPNDLKSVVASSEGVDSSSENEIQKLNIGTCLLTGVIDIPLKVNIRPRVSKHGGETVDITLPYEVDDNAKKSNAQIEESSPFDSNFNSNSTSSQTNNSNSQSESSIEPKSTMYKGANSEFIQFVAPEIEADDAKVMLGSDQIEAELIPGSIVKIKTSQGKESSILVERVNGTIIKNLFPFEGVQINSNLNKLSDTEKKILQVILSIVDKFNPAELLLKTDVMFNEILRICDSLAKKGLLKKIDRELEVSGAKFAKEIDSLNFYGNQKFEEVSYDTKISEKISETNLKETLSLFGEVQNMKEIFIIKYIGK